MSTRIFHYRWEWLLPAPPSALWPLVSDTNRFNRDTGVPDVVEVASTDQGEPPVAGRRRLRLTRFGVEVEWDEDPFEWVRPHRFGVVRRYRRGPVAEMRVLTELTPEGENSTRLVYQVWARPRNLLGFVAIPLQIGLLSAHSFNRAIRRYGEVAAASSARVKEGPLPEAPILQPSGRGSLVPGGRERLAVARTALLERGISTVRADLITGLVEEGDDLFLSRLRPYELADFWGEERRDILELCLHATRGGLLDLRWDVLCPMCRGGGALSTLGDVTESAHCESCNIDFTVNFDRQVELTFRPNAAIRTTFVGAYCIGGPQLTPHIVLQQTVPIGEERISTLHLEPGRYRLRTAGLPGGHFLQVGEDGAREVVLKASSQGWPEEEPLLHSDVTLTLRNATSSDQRFILERTAWSDQAATAAEVIGLQLFRDLFAGEALRPGERISVGSLTLLFTDLRDSTRLYRESGDAVAFGRVMSHFDILRETIAAEDGAVVKTIGDSVMAVFGRPVAALRAVLRAQEALLAGSSEALPSLRLKAGVHTGPCVAVTLNDRLDYFGTTVNIAARLEGLASARPGVVASSAVMADPEVSAWIFAGGAHATRFEAQLKGFEGERFELWEVSPS